MNIKEIKEFNFLNPEGIEVSLDNFKTEQEANNYLDKWIGYFEKKGFYLSPIFGKITLDKLKDYCEPVTVEMTLRADNK